MKLSESLHDPCFHNCSLLFSQQLLPDLSFPLAPWNCAPSLTKEIALWLLWNRCENSCLGWKDLWQLQKLPLTNHNENTIILVYLLFKLPSRTDCSKPGTLAEENNLKKSWTEHLFNNDCMKTMIFFSHDFSLGIPFLFGCFQVWRKVSWGEQCQSTSYNFLTDTFL